MPFIGYEQANELVFVNGNYSRELSVIRSAELQLLSLHEAAEHVDFCDLVLRNVGHSSTYLKDGINALNTAFIHNGVFLYVSRGKITEHPVYIKMYRRLGAINHYHCTNLVSKTDYFPDRVLRA